jgi:DNA-binding transcriptional MerR regulator
MPFVPKKLYYKIREVCEIIGVEAHVLRYWETEFPALSPPKSKSGQRTYRPKDIELLLQIRKLLYEDGFTIAGARKRLSTRRPADDLDEVEKDRSLPPVAAESVESNPKAGADQGSKSDRLRKVQTELENILTLLDRG